MMCGIHVNNVKIMCYTLYVLWYCSFATPELIIIISHSSQLFTRLNYIGRTISREKHDNAGGKYDHFHQILWRYLNFSKLD